MRVGLPYLIYHLLILACEAKPNLAWSTTCDVFMNSLVSGPPLTSIAITLYFLLNSVQRFRARIGAPVSDVMTNYNHRFAIGFKTCLPLIDFIPIRLARGFNCCL